MASKNYTKNKASFCLVGKLHTLIFAGLISGSMVGNVFAQAASGGAVMAPTPVMLSATAASPVVHAVLTESAGRDAQSYTVSAAISPVAYAVVPDGSLKTSPQGPEADSDPDGQTSVGQNKDEAFQLPYALVLALFALIGLVPVSRRNH